MRCRKHFSQTHSRVCYFKINISVRGAGARVFTAALCHFCRVKPGFFFFRTFKSQACVHPASVNHTKCAVSVTAAHPFNLRASFPPIFKVPQAPDLSSLPLSVLIMMERQLSFFEGIVGLCMRIFRLIHFCSFNTVCSLLIWFIACFSFSKKQLTVQNQTNLIWAWPPPTKKHDMAYRLGQTALRIRSDGPHLKKKKDAAKYNNDNRQPP